MTGSDPAGAPRVVDRRIRRVALLVNPVSGHGAGGVAAHRAAAAFARRGIVVESLVGDSAEHSRDLARRAVADRAVDALVVCGGDGLISLAVQELVGSDLPLGVVPAGTGNDFARDLGIAGIEVERAVEIVARGRAERADLGRVVRADGTEAHFATLLCAGFDSAVNAQVNALRWPHGRARYVLACVLTYPTYPVKRYRLTFDDDEVVETGVILSAYAITQYYGGGMRICPDADRGDGLIDVTWIGDVPRLRAAWEFRKVFSGRHIGLPGVETRRCRRVRIEADRSVEAFADGDHIADLPVTVDVVPSAVSYLVP